MLKSRLIKNAEQFRYPDFLTLFNMNKSISTLVLVGISALIVLYILNSFHKVFNRQSIHEQASTATATDQPSVNSAATVQGIINLNEQITESAALAAKENSENDTKLDEAIATTSNSDTEESETADTQSTDNLATASSSSDDIEEEVIADITGTPGDMLRDKPHLQNALPPIPQAPPRPQGSPVITTPSEESFSTTGTSNSSFPAPITNTNPAVDNTSTSSGGSAFPAPIISDSQGSTNSYQGQSSFPAPR